MKRKEFLQSALVATAFSVLRDALATKPIAVKRSFRFAFM